MASILASVLWKPSRVCNQKLSPLSTNQESLRTINLVLQIAQLQDRVLRLPADQIVVQPQRLGALNCFLTLFTGSTLFSGYFRLPFRMADELDCMSMYADMQPVTKFSKFVQFLLLAVHRSFSSCSRKATVWSNRIHEF